MKASSRACFWFGVSCLAGPLSADSQAETVTQVASNLVQGLSDEQRKFAVQPRLASPPPFRTRMTNGIQFASLSQDQRQLIYRLLVTARGTGRPGSFGSMGSTSQATLALNQLLKSFAGLQNPEGVTSNLSDWRFLISGFSSTNKTWQFELGGSQGRFQFMFVQDRVMTVMPPTPVFTSHGGKDRPLFEFLDSLPPQMQNEAIIPQLSERRPPGTMIAQPQVGLACAKLNNEQLARLKNVLVGMAYGRTHMLADESIARIEAYNWAETSIAVFGSTNRGSNYLFRVHGPDFCTETGNYSFLTNDRTLMLPPTLKK